MNRSHPLLESTLSRRRLLGATAAGGAGLAGLTLVGCGGDDDAPGDATPGTTPTSSAGDAPATEPKRGGTLTVDSGEPAPDALVFGFNAANYYLRGGVWANLIVQGQDNRPELRLAESFEMRPDFTGVQIKLRPGLEFHDGRPLTAEDVEYSIELFRADSTTSQLKNPGKLISDIKIVDPLTLDISFSAPRPFMEDYFALLPIVDKETVAEAAQMRVLNGAGPFKFVSYTPNQGYVMERNPNYFDPDKPYVDRIEGRIYADQQSRILALQTGELMHTNLASPALVKQLQGNKDITISEGEIGGSWYAGLVVTHPILADKRVRQALTLSIDRQRIADEWGEGVIPPRVLPWPDDSPAFNAEDEKLLEYDPERAKALLKEAGAEGFSLPMDIGQGREDLAQYAQDDWKLVGVDAQLNVSEYSAYLERFRQRKVETVFIAPFGFSNAMHPATFFDFTQPVRIPNASHYEPDSYKELLAKITETDPHSEEGQELLREWNRLYLIEDPWLVPLAPSLSFYAMNKSVVSPFARSRDTGILGDIWIND